MLIAPKSNFTDRSQLMRQQVLEIREPNEVRCKDKWYDLNSDKIKTPEG